MAKSNLDRRLVQLRERLKELPGARSVRFQPYSDPTGTGMRVAVPGVCEHVLLRPEDREPPAGPWSPTHLDLALPDVETGDADFDRNFHIVGPPALVLALLSEETRRALVDLRWGPVPFE